MSLEGRGSEAARLQLGVSGPTEDDAELLLLGACMTCHTMYQVPRGAIECPLLCEASRGSCAWCVAHCPAEQREPSGGARKLIQVMRIEHLCTRLKARAKLRFEELQQLQQQLACNARSTIDARRAFEGAVERAKSAANRSEVRAHFCTSDAACLRPAACWPPPPRAQRGTAC